MKKWSLIAATICISVSAFAATDKKIERKSYEEACRQTAIIHEQEDEKLFLTPHLQSDVAELTGQLILDAGCGTGAWAQSLVNKGARVCVLESQQETLDQLQRSIAMAGIEEQLSLLEGNPVAMPYEDGVFDGAVSIYVGDDLPKTVHKFSEGCFVVGGLELHMHELARVMKNEAQATVVAPASYDVVFTMGEQSNEEAHNHIQSVLSKLMQNATEIQIAEALATLTEVNRATFMERNGQLVLVTQTSDLKNGEIIWRKECDEIRKSFYHSEEEYLVAFANAGLKCVEVKRPCFFGNVKYRQYQANRKGQACLGTSYIEHNPFTIYTLVKSVS